MELYIVKMVLRRCTKKTWPVYQLLLVNSKTTKLKLLDLKLAAAIGCQVIDDVRPQLSKFFVADALNDVDSNAMQLLVDVIDTSTSHVNPLHHITAHASHSRSSP